MTKKIWLVLAASLLLSVSCGDPGFDHSSSPSIDSSDSLKDKEFEEGSPLLFSEFYLGELIKNRVVEFRYGTPFVKELFHPYLSRNGENDLLYDSLGR